MHPLNPLFSIIIFFLACLTGYIININNKEKSTPGRYASIDGMRGFLALGVFIHHSSVWHQYVQTRKWEAPQSNLYNHFGKTSVLLFFMITSFLFITKLINSKEKEFNWKHFFISRVYRIVPMYYFSISILIILIMIMTHWKLNVTPYEFIKSLLNWYSFTIVECPDISNSEVTSIIDARVTWSLRYEWLFYFSLPLISLIILKNRTPKLYIVLSIIFIALFATTHGVNPRYLIAFLGGAVAPVIIKYTSLKKYADTPFISILVLLLIFLIGQFSSSNHIICLALISIVFTCIALGNSLFGLLKNSTLKFLGEICYSTYLLHGIILFILMHFLVGMDTLKKLSPSEFCVIIFAITPLVVVISFLGFTFIEKPFINRGKNKF